MRRRQSIPAKWLIAIDGGTLEAARRLPCGSGVLLVDLPRAGEMRELRNLARRRNLVLVLEQPRAAVRVHGSRELRRAMLARTPLILLSPLFRTSSHPDWKPIPRMRAGALARLGRRRLIALGGMDAQRYAAIAPLGFVGWAGISAWK